MSTDSYEVFRLFLDSLSPPEVIMVTRESSCIHIFFKNSVHGSISLFDLTITELIIFCYELVFERRKFVQFYCTG